MSWMLIADSWPMHYLVIPWCGQWCCCYYQLCFTGTDVCSKCGAIFNILLKVVIVELYCSFVVIRHAVNRHILESLFLLTDSRGTCYFTCGRVRSIVISVSVCLCIYISVWSKISSKPHKFFGKCVICVCSSILFSWHCGWRHVFT